MTRSHGGTTRLKNIKCNKTKQQGQEHEQKHKKMNNSKLTKPDFAKLQRDQTWHGHKQECRTRGKNKCGGTGGKYGRGKCRLPAWHSRRNEFHKKIEKVMRQIKRKPINSIQNDSCIFWHSTIGFLNDQPATPVALHSFNTIILTCSRATANTPTCSSAMRKRTLWLKTHCRSRLVVVSFSIFRWEVKKSNEPKLRHAAPVGRHICGRKSAVPQM